ncbi:purine nucleoside permease [Irpex rosettiformis]|uniref:Purine nucleoside permease n=1 Tax=Irpex rosettiformis TaxID=378272 RepID=A0ACB8U1E1_9APHY|nr:purine nucleoside permease [Irpex rosettiformis]
MWPKLVIFACWVSYFVCALASSVSLPSGKHSNKIQPKVFIIGMFSSEGNIWHGISEFDVLAQNITVPGFSPLFQQAHCTADGSICQLVTGEGEINAAVTISALSASALFDLRTTYFLIAGIAGINPALGTVGGVTFARFAVQVGLQYEFDAREIPANFSTGYVPQGSKAPGQYPATLYGTEVFEVNDNLRQLAISFARNATLYDDANAQAYRALYANHSGWTAATQPPSIVGCDTVTSDQFFSGALLADAMSNYTSLVTNGTATYCTTQQEDNATLEALTRAALFGLVDFARIIVMRTGSNFDRPYDGQTPQEHLFSSSPGFLASIRNLHVAGAPVVLGIVEGWEKTFKRGVKPSNYVGDILGTLGGVPDFGPGSKFGGQSANATA